MTEADDDRRSPEPIPGAEHLAGARDDEPLMGSLGQEIASRLERSLPGITLGALLGRGGAGWVYRGVLREESVAIKALVAPAAAHRSPWAERFEREVRVLERLEHPGIVGILDHGIEDELAWIVMELVEGTSLRELLEEGPLAPDEALAIARGMAEALDYAHRQGVVHRDIKPENVLLTEEGEVRLVDFGIAKLMAGPEGEAALTRPSQALGTLRYIAPEQLDAPSEVDHRADIYGLGVVTYEMLTGVVPQGVVEPPSSLAPVPEDVDTLLFRALARDPDRRHRSVADLLDSLDALPLVEGTPLDDWLRVEETRNARMDVAVLALSLALFSAIYFNRPDLRHAGLPGAFTIIMIVAGLKLPMVARLWTGQSAVPFYRLGVGVGSVFLVGFTFLFFGLLRNARLSIGYVLPATHTVGCLQIILAPLSRIGPAGFLWSAGARGVFNLLAIVALGFLVLNLAPLTLSGVTPLIWFGGLQAMVAIALLVHLTRNTDRASASDLVTLRTIGLMGLAMIAYWMPLASLTGFGPSAYGVPQQGVVLIACLGAAEGAGTPARRFRRNHRARR